MYTVETVKKILKSRWFSTMPKYKTLSNIIGTNVLFPLTIGEWLSISCLCHTRSDNETQKSIEVTTHF